MDMQVIEASDFCTHVKLAGKMNVEGVQDVERPFTDLVAGRLKPTIVEIEGISFLSSLGVRTFLFSIKALRRAGVKMVMVNPQPSVLKVLETAGLGLIVPCVDTVEEARHHLLLDAPEAPGSLSE